MKTLLNILPYILIMSLFNLSAQDLQQTLKGKIFDRLTHIALPGATIIVTGTDPLIATISDNEGMYRLDNVPLGRYDVEIRFLGYETTMIPEVLVGSAKEIVLNIDMAESVGSLNEVVISSGVNKFKPRNSMATVSARSFNVEETRRYAGGMDDPARLASAFAGVAAGGNHQDNAIVIRGNAPKNVLWRIEGVDIPNPSHFSGGNVAGGGLVTTISSQMLANSDFYTGAFPAEFGNALGGVFDLRLRVGNHEKHEKTIQVGVLGIDLSAEGPLLRKNNASYLFNYRYSTFGLLSNLGLMPTDQTPVYQDLSFKMVFPTRETGVFSLWGIGGIDHLTDKAEVDSTLWETDYDRMRNHWDENFGAVGINHKLSISLKTFLNTSLVATGNFKELTQQRLDDDLVLQNDIGIRNKNGKLSLNSFVNHKLNPRLNLRTGFNLNTLFYNYDLSGTDNSIPGTYKNYTNDSGVSQHIQAHVQMKYNVGKSFSLSGGFQAEYFTLNDALTVDPRFALQWNLTPIQTLSLGYGKHSQLEDLNIYFIKTIENEQTHYYNKNLDFSHAHHFVLGYDHRFNDHTRVKLEPYYQYLYDIPGRVNHSFSMINFRQDLSFQEKLENNSIGRNFGVDITLEHFLKNNFYYTVTASFFDSKYRADDGIWRDTRYNKNLVGNILVGKEFNIGKAGNNLLGVNLRGTVSGGQYNTPLKEAESNAAKRPVYDEANAFSQKDEMSLFFSLSATYRINKPNHSSVFALQLNNVLGAKQSGEYEYNYKQNASVRSAEVYQLPLISYKLEF